MKRIFVGMGQGGYSTSMGMVGLYNRIRQMPETHTTLHSWGDNKVIEELNTTLRDGVTKTAFIGFSLGANDLARISRLVNKRIYLGVAYDPSWMSPEVHKTEFGYTSTAAYFKRLLCYYNSGAWIWGGAKYVGPNVELTSVSNFHLAMQFDETLHTKTLNAIKDM